MRLVVDEDCAEQCLLGLEIVGRCPERQGFGRGGIVARLAGLAACCVDHGRGNVRVAAGGRYSHNRHPSYAHKGKISLDGPNRCRRAYSPAMSGLAGTPASPAISRRSSANM